MTETINSGAIRPMEQSERILLIDSLRGIADPGILLMNIPGFALPHPLIMDISLRDESRFNYWIWHIFGDGVLEGTMRA